MNIVVIGLGSMGKRRIRLLKQYVNQEIEKRNEWTLVGVDYSSERCEEVESLYQMQTFHSVKEAINEIKLDCAVISTSPHTHGGIIEECLENGLHVFTEINLIDDGYDRNIALAQKMNKILFLSSTFMYRKEIEYIKQKVVENKFNGIYSYHIGQYLPEWHPWENYKNFFVGRKDTNGCREIFAIELPWILDVFGKVKRIHSIHKKSSNLEINYDDSYLVQLEHESGIIGSLVVDIVTPKAGRNLELWSEGFYLGWNGTADSLIEYDQQKKKIEAVKLYENVEHRDGYQQFIVENAYYDELVNFIDCVEKKANPRHNFEKDKVVLQLIDEIEI